MARIHKNSNAKASFHLNLTDVNVGLKDFVRGELEDWTEGALKLNGRDQYCVIRDTDLKSDYTYGRGRGGDKVTYPGSKRRTLDMDASNIDEDPLFVSSARWPATATPLAWNRTA